MSETTGSEMQAAVAEYQSLRNEALQHMSERRHLLWLCILTCTTTLGAAAQTKIAWLAALPMVVIPAFSIILMVGFNGPQRIGAYIRVFIENRYPGFGFENALYVCYKHRLTGLRVCHGNRGFFVIGWTFLSGAFALASAALTVHLGPSTVALPVSLLGLSLVIVGNILLVREALYKVRKRWARAFKESYRILYEKKVVQQDNGCAEPPPASPP